MSKQPNHQADIKNANRGTSGTNTTYDKAQGNRGKQMHPNWTPPPPGQGKGNKGGKGPKK